MQMATKAAPRAGYLVFELPGEMPVSTIVRDAKERFVEARMGAFHRLEGLMGEYIGTIVSAKHQQQSSATVLELQDILRLAQVCRTLNSVAHSRAVSKAQFVSLFATGNSSDEALAAAKEDSGPLLVPVDEANGSTQGTGMVAAADIQAGTSVGVYSGVCREVEEEEDAQNIFLFGLDPLPCGCDATGRNGFNFVPKVDHDEILSTYTLISGRSGYRTKSLPKWDEPKKNLVLDPLGLPPGVCRERFINHSCDPNLSAAIYDLKEIDPEVDQGNLTRLRVLANPTSAGRLPGSAAFPCGGRRRPEVTVVVFRAEKDIKKGEELTLDYDPRRRWIEVPFERTAAWRTSPMDRGKKEEDGVWMGAGGYVGFTCRCGTGNCRGEVILSHDEGDPEGDEDDDEEEEEEDEGDEDDEADEDDEDDEDEEGDEDGEEGE